VINRYAAITICNAIAFTDNNSIQLDHQIEDYNSTTGHLVAWVSVPILPSDEDTILYMYYGNPAAINQENSELVWDSNHVAVWHLNETSGTIYDSTQNYNHGIEYISPDSSMDSVGIIDGADYFDGSDDYIAIPDEPSLDLGGSGTISAWFKTSGAGGDYILNFDESTGGRWGIRVMSDYLDAQFRDLSGSLISGTQVISTTDVDNNAWHMVIMVYDGIDLILYIDGSEEDRNNAPGKTIANITNTGHIGNHAGGTSLFNGTIDEVRVSNTGRSAGWIETSYNNQNNPGSFYTVGNEEEPVYSISGHISDPNNRPLANVLVDANNGAGSDITDVNGFYELWVGYHWSGIVAPGKQGYYFDPNEDVYTNVLDDYTDMDFMGIRNEDINIDGFIDEVDLWYIVEYWLQEDPPDGDLFEDDFMNFLDFAKLAKVWLIEEY